MQPRLQRGATATAVTGGGRRSVIRPWNVNKR